MTNSRTFFCSSLNDIGAGRWGGFVAGMGSKSPHERGSWRFWGGGTAPGERERFCEAVNDDEARGALSASRLATPSWMAFLRVSESVLRLGAVGGPGVGAGGVSDMLFEEKSRFMVARPERGCRSGCITSSDDERNVQGATFIHGILARAKGVT